MNITSWWKNLSVSTKLYSVVGVMALLIASELMTLLFAMTTLSAVRALVEGEGLWSKSQKNAIYSLQRYVATKNEAFYEQFRDELKIPLGDHQARLALAQPKVNDATQNRVLLRGAITQATCRQ